MHVRICRCSPLAKLQPAQVTSEYEPEAFIGMKVRNGPSPRAVRAADWIAEATSDTSAAQGRPAPPTRGVMFERPGFRGHGAKVAQSCGPNDSVDSRMSGEPMSRSFAADHGGET